MKSFVFKALVAFFVSGVLLAGQPLFAQDSTPLVDVNVGALDAEPGQYVLCPSRQFYDGALEKGLEKTTFIYYAATLIESGDSESTVKSLAGSEYSLPNEFIIPIPAGQTANVGDILLTWWQSGSGMQRAIVVGGTESEPVVRYLDIDYDNPSGAGKKEDTLRKNSFVVLNQPWQIGSTVSVDTGGAQHIGHLLAADDNKILVREFAGKLNCYDRQLATPLPQQPALNDGDSAMAELFGSLKPVTVVSVDEKIGRVFASYQFAGQEKQKAFAYGLIVSESAKGQ